MGKRGVEYSAVIALEFVLLIMMAIMLAIAIKQAPHEERINNLKTIDLGLTLDAVSSAKGDVYLNYDLGKGMYVEIESNKIMMYRKNELKAGEEILSINSRYNVENLLEKKYDSLYIIKEGDLIKIE